MTDIRGMVQAALDDKFQGGLKSFWQLKTGDLTEYIVYTLGNDKGQTFADDEVLVKSTDVTLRYYYDAKKISTEAGRMLVKQREQDIALAMRDAGFYSVSGMFDAGDIDNIGYFASVCEFNYTRLA